MKTGLFLQRGCRLGSTRTTITEVSCGVPRHHAVSVT